MSIKVEISVVEVFWWTKRWKSRKLIKTFTGFNFDPMAWFVTQYIIIAPMENACLLPLSPASLSSPAMLCQPYHLLLCSSHLYYCCFHVACMPSACTFIDQGNSFVFVSILSNILNMATSGVRVFCLFVILLVLPVYYVMCVCLWK